MEIPMDIPNLCNKAANSDLNSDLDCSDVDCDSDSQNKPNAKEKSATEKRDEACEKLKELFFARVSTDSTGTDCSIEFKPHTITTASESNSPDNNKIEATMGCDSSRKSEGFCIVQNLVSSTDDIGVAEEHGILIGDHKTVDMFKSVPNNDCVSVSVAGVTLATDLTENST